MLCNSVQTFFVYQQNLSINVYFFPFKNENNLKGSLEIIVEINFLLYRIILTCFRVFFCRAFNKTNENRKDTSATFPLYIHVQRFYRE